VKPRDAEILLVKNNADHAGLALHAGKENHQFHPIHLVRDDKEALKFLFGKPA
jgi:hypothetical protein